jgi:hypothetical protein
MVDIEFFQGRAFARKRYLQQTTKVVKQLLKALQADGTEPIQICSGCIFDHARRALGRRVHQRKITGHLQNLIEDVATDHLAGLGIPINGVGPGAKHFMICLSWVAEDFTAREGHCKTGWQSWHKKWRRVARRGAVRW